MVRHQCEHKDRYLPATGGGAGRGASLECVRGRDERGSGEQARRRRTAGCRVGVVFPVAGFGSNNPSGHLNTRTYSSSYSLHTTLRKVRLLQQALRADLRCCRLQVNRNPSY